MKGSAFVPGHITGFFEILDNKDPIKAGSRGAGIVLDKGVHTTVKIKEGSSISTLINGEPCACPVTRTVVEEISKTAGEMDLEVRHKLDIPMKYGLGASGAGAFGTALAIARALNLNLTADQCGAIAHGAEVLNRTGMGDVIAQSIGGLAIRTEPGAPGTGDVNRISSEKKVVAFIVGDEMETQSVLDDGEKVDSINTAGSECLKAMLNNPTPENFLNLSKRFAIDTGLIGKEVYSAVKKLEENGITASMSMLGNCVFTLTDEPETVSELLDYLYIIADIDYNGARTI